GGMQPIQPVHLHDLVGAVVALVESAQPVRGRLQVVGPEATTLKAYLQAIRKGLGLGTGTWLPVPRAIMARLAQAGSRHRGALFDEDSWRMLQRGNTGPATSLSALLGRPPRSAETFVSALPHSEREALRHHAVMAWSRPLWRASLALLWFASGLVSLGLYPVADSFAMLAQVGIPATLRPVALYGAAGLDIALGVLTLWRSGRRVWLAQIGLILAYTAVITLFLPAQWLHPFAPIVKNGPILAMLLTLYATETRR
uniref:SDR family oxidoreductase n=1 Tax=uncultured Aquabacterium sp. TaxID=158753 RepID=UPI002619BF54